MTAAASDSPLGRALARAIAQLRTELRDPLAPITVVVPAGPNGTLARRALATQGDILRVWFETPDGLLRDQLPATAWHALHPEPPGWLRVTLEGIVRDLHQTGELGRFGAALTRRGFLDPLVSALGRLEASGVGPEHLAGVTAPPHVAERAHILAALLRALQEARARDALASSQELARAATDAIGRERGVGAALATGAVVIGDRELSLPTQTFLRAWLAQRKVLQVRAAPSSNLPDAPWGIRSACAGAPAIDVDTSGLPPDLRAVLTHLFGPAPAAPAAASPSSARAVTFARTPDDVRECLEAVREVQRAIAAGTPLDRIAIVLPDSAPRAALEDALDRAGIPATWFAGFPAKDLAAARLLRLALNVALDTATPRTLYELLTHPALDLRARLGPDAVKGRGRWRARLSRISRARGLEHIIAGIERLPVRDGVTPEELERETAARTSLIACTRALAEATALLRIEGPLGAHARTWREFLYAFSRRSEARGRVLALIEPLAASDAGPTLSAIEAREELEALLERELAQGNLAERSVRVLAPMHLLGGEVDVLVMLGLVHGRFPQTAREDPVLPDALLTALGTVVGRALPLSREREELERRRFAAALGAVRQSAWLGIPALTFRDERPSLPSPFALDALAAVLGRRAQFGDLEPRAGHACVVVSGTRARTWPADPNDSVGALEHLVARLSIDGTPALHALASHATSRALLQLQRSIDKARAGTLDPWTGVVPPDVLPIPGVDGTPVALRLLVQLAADPGTFFFRTLLQTQKPPRLVPWGGPLDRPTLAALLLDIAQDAVVPTGDVGEALAASVMAKLEEQRALGAFTDPALQQAQPMVQAIARAAAQEIEAFSRAQIPAGPLTLDDALPWRTEDTAGRVVALPDGPALVGIDRKIERQTMKPPDCPDLVLTAVGFVRAGMETNELRVLTPDGKEAVGSLAVLRDEALDKLRHATEAARAGRYAIGGAEDFRLRAERPSELVEPPDPDADADDTGATGGGADA